MRNYERAKKRTLCGETGVRIPVEASRWPDGIERGVRLVAGRVLTVVSDDTLNAIVIAREARFDHAGKHGQCACGTRVVGTERIRSNCRPASPCHSLSARGDGLDSRR